MTITQIRYFLAVCRYRNYTKAAEKMFVAQPTVSQSIRDLEVECGVPLFYKEGAYTELTEAGRVLKEEAEKMIRQYDQVNDIIRNSHLTRNFLRIGFATFAGNEIMPKLIARYRKKFPDIRIKTFEKANDELLQMLSKREIDLAILSGEPEMIVKKYPDLKTMDLLPFRMGYFVSRQSPLAKRKSITLKEISDYPLVIMDEQYANTQRILSAFHEQSLQPMIILQTSQMFTLLRFITFEAAGGFAPENLKQTNPKIVMIPCTDNPFSFDSTVRLIYNTKSQMVPAMKNFIELAMESSK